MTEYQWYRQHGICTDCHSENALPRIAYCRCCKAMRIEYNRVSWEKCKEKRIPINREQHKNLYWQRKEAGLCTRCGKNAPETGKAKCTRCLRKDAGVHKKSARGRGVQSRYDWLRQELCWTCGKYPHIQGKKLCQSCYDKSLVSLAEARKHITSGWMLEGFLFGKYGKEADYGN